MAKSENQGKGLGVVLGAAALATVGAYFLYGSKNAAKNRQKVKSWALKAKAEVLEQVEKVKQLDAQQYKVIVDKVLEGYQGMHGTTQREIKALGAELKQHWMDLQKNSSKKKKPARKKTTRKKSSPSAEQS